MHPRLHAVLPRCRQNALVPQGHQPPVRPDAVGKRRHIGHVGQHLPQQVVSDEGIGVAVHPQRPALGRVLQGHNQLLPGRQRSLPL